MQKSIRLVSGLYLKLSLLTVAVGLVLRVVLLFNEQTTSLAFSFGEWCEVFLLGAVNDFCAATAGFIFLWLFMLSVSRTKYRKPWGYILLALLVAAFCYVAFFNTIFDEYGSVAPRIALYVLGYWAGSFALRLFLPGFRSHWTTVWFALFIVVYVGAIIFNGISEFFFWNEFGVRYNFIAVDYLVYTNEVVGNIMESYPVIPMTLGIVVVTLLVTWYLFRRELVQTECLKGWRWKAVIGPAYVAALFAAIGLLNFNTRFQDSDNVYVNELQANGLYKFYDAFVKNTLDYEQFYLTRPEAEAEAFVHGVYQSTGDNLHAVRAEGEEIRRNIVLITMESMSASYMERFGNTERITPALDSLYKLGLAFDRVYATGNRTVRGLEAVTLSLPPCPGQSIIKRPNNAGMHSTGALLRDKGYNVTYFYGGNSYFDNMETFFSGNGYDIVDQKSYKPEEITFANIWGVCDEDAYRKVIRTLNEETRSGKPFFAHVMTVSNHRPFTYPAGRIRIPNDSKSRAGGVLYSDYSLGRFFAEAARQPWFENTIFLVTADHRIEFARTGLFVEVDGILAQRIELLLGGLRIDRRTLAEGADRLNQLLFRRAAALEDVGGLPALGHEGQQQVFDGGVFVAEILREVHGPLDRLRGLLCEELLAAAFDARQRRHGPADLVAQRTYIHSHAPQQERRERIVLADQHREQVERFDSLLSPLPRQRERRLQRLLRLDGKSVDVHNM